MFILVESNTAAIIGAIFGGVTAFMVALLKFFGNKTIKKKLEEVKKERNELLSENYELEHKINSMKQSFNMGYNQLRTDFKNKPQKMRLWDNIKDTFDEN